MKVLSPWAISIRLKEYLLKKFPQGHYTLEDMAIKMDDMFKKRGYADNFKVTRNEPFSRFLINNHGDKEFEFDRDLAAFFGTKRKFQAEITYICQQATSNGRTSSIAI